MYPKLIKGTQHTHFAGERYILKVHFMCILYTFSYMPYVGARLYSSYGLYKMLNPGPFNSISFARL